MALETAAEQLAIIDDMSPRDRNTFLANAVLQFDSVGRRPARCSRRGDADADADAVDQLVNGPLARHSAAKRALVDDRNRR